MANPNLAPPNSSDTGEGHGGLDGSMDLGVHPLWAYGRARSGFQPTGDPWIDRSIQTVRQAVGLDAPVPDDLAANRAAPPPRAATYGLLGSIPAREPQHSAFDGSTGRQRGKAPAAAMAPSPHAGTYPTLDEAALAAASDVPKGAGVEYGTFFPENVVTEMVDFDDGFGPQSVSRVTGFTYGGLVTSNDGSKVELGPAPPHLGGWFHNHPQDLDNEINLWNQRPSSDDRGRGDWGFIKRLQERNNPLLHTYILGPDGRLRKFWLPSDRGQEIK